MDTFGQKSVKKTPPCNVIIVIVTSGRDVSPPFRRPSEMMSRLVMEEDKTVWTKKFGLVSRNTWRQ